MNTALKISYTLMACIALSLSACKHDDRETSYQGATARTATNEFVVGDICLVGVNSLTGVSGNVCDPSYKPIFGTSKNCYFVCDFNQEVTWTITITGRTSGAVKVLHGTTNGLSFGNSESVWKGDADGYRFFLRDEVCDVKITFLGSSIERHTTLRIDGRPIATMIYKNTPGVMAILDNLDDVGSTSLTYSYTDMEDGGRNAIDLCRDNGLVTPIDGYFMLRLKGHDGNSNTYLGGTGPELLTSHAALIRMAVRSGETDPSKLYFNMYVYGTGLSNTNLQIRAYELDGLSNTATISEPLPVYNAESERSNDQWAYNLYINWTGWKLVSIPYTAFKRSDNPAKGGNGNGVREPRKITAFNLLLQSLPNPGGEVDTYVDFMTITWDKPFYQ